MTAFIFALVLTAIALLAIAVRRTYAIVPPKELKRAAAAGDPTARVLYRAVAYDGSLQAFLWLVIVVATAGSFALLAHIVPTFLAFILEAMLLGYGFGWMPSSEVTHFGMRMVLWVTPGVVWFISHLYPVFERIASFVKHHRPVTIHTGLYEREDLLSLLDRQKSQADSRFSEDELKLLAHALTYSQKTVVDIVIPRRAVRGVRATDAIGPILMKELHDSGHSRFPVYQDADHVVGTLYLRDLVDVKKSGTVEQLMEKSVYYVHEDYSLEQVLHAFLTTKHHLFIVVNNFEEYVGIVTIEDVLEQIIGRKIIDEFDRYDDLRAVTADQAHKEHVARHKAGQEFGAPAEPEIHSGSAGSSASASAPKPAAKTQTPAAK